MWVEDRGAWGKRGKGRLVPLFAPVMAMTLPSNWIFCTGVTVSVSFADSVDAILGY